jgi:hypothetical protein
LKKFGKAGNEQRKPLYPKRSQEHPSAHGEETRWLHPQDLFCRVFEHGTTRVFKQQASLDPIAAVSSRFDEFQL